MEMQSFLWSWIKIWFYDGTNGKILLSIFQAFWNEFSFMNVCESVSNFIFMATCVISDLSGIIQLQQTSRIDFDVDLGQLDRQWLLTQCHVDAPPTPGLHSCGVRSLLPLGPQAGTQTSWQNEGLLCKKVLESILSRTTFAELEVRILTCWRSGWIGLWNYWLNLEVAISSPPSEI